MRSLPAYLVLGSFSLSALFAMGWALIMSLRSGAGDPPLYSEAI